MQAASPAARWSCSRAPPTPRCAASAKRSAGDGVFDKSIETDALIDYCLRLSKRWHTELHEHAAILVVDDNPDHLELTVMALGDCCDPAEIATATDGVEALDYLFGRGAHAELVTPASSRG